MPKLKCKPGCQIYNHFFGASIPIRVSNCCKFVVNKLKPNPEKTPGIWSAKQHLELTSFHFSELKVIDLQDCLSVLLY